MDLSLAWASASIIVKYTNLSCTVDANHLAEVQKGFLQLLELGKHSDVTFIITENGEDHRIPAHRVILASQSEYFDQLLFGEMMEAYPRVEIQLWDTPLEAFQLLMKYTYCGEMKIKDSDLQVLIATYHTYIGTVFPQERLKMGTGLGMGDIRNNLGWLSCV